MGILTDIFGRNPFTDDNPKRQLCRLYAVAIIVTILVQACLPTLFSSDSYSYIDAGKIFASGSIDTLRTPLYPLVCYSMQAIFGEGYGLAAVTILQQILFLLSLYAFYRTAQYFLKSPAAIFTVSLIYAVHPGIVLWNRFILSESLAVSGAVFLFYFLVRLHRRRSTVTAVATVLLAIALTALRPGSIYLLPALGAYTVYLLYKRRREALILLAGGAVAAGCALSYCKAYEKKFGIFAASNVTDINTYHLLRFYNLLEPNDIPDEAMRLQMEKILPQKAPKGNYIYYEEFFALTDSFGTAKVHCMVSNALNNHGAEYLAAMCRQAAELIYFPAFVYYISPDDAPTLFFTGIRALFFLLTFSMHVVYLLLFWYTVGILIYSWRKRKIPILHICLLFMVAANLLMAIFGAMSEWHRLIVPSAPFLFMIMAIAADKLPIKKR